jgi:hypothetical protein
LSGSHPPSARLQGASAGPESQYAPEAAADPNYGQQQLKDQTTAAVQNALPSFLQNMQGTKEDNIRRGISTGDLGTSFENDLTSAFQRNIANSVAGQESGLLQSRTGSLLGAYNDDLDREQAARNNASGARSGFIGGLIKTGGYLAGGF